VSLLQFPHSARKHCKIRHATRFGMFHRPWVHSIFTPPLLSGQFKSARLFRSPALLGGSSCRSRFSYAPSVERVCSPNTRRAGVRAQSSDTSGTPRISHYPCVHYPVLMYCCINFSVHVGLFHNCNASVRTEQMTI
jgi:hypothetical protein